MDEQVDLTRFTEYTFRTDFMTPSGGWSFTVADEDLPEAQRNALKSGARVRLSVDNIPMADGHIDMVKVGASRGGGQVWSVTGRERIALALDATADPVLQFKDGATLSDVLREVFTPFGWSGENHFAIDNVANRNAMTGGTRGEKYSKAKKKFGQPLAKYTAHKLKPFNHESVYKFATRCANRFGLHIWQSADGETLIVGEPDFTQDPSYQIRRKLDGSGNVIDGWAQFDGTNQPSVMFADGFSGGGEYGKGQVAAYCVNPYFGVDADGFVLPEVSAIIARHPEAKQITMTTQPFTRRVATIPPRPMWLHDDSSKTQDQIENYLRREMSGLLRQSLTCDYLLEGHGQYDEDGFIVFGYDTVVDVDDEVTGVKERMYVLGCEYMQSRGAGTTTRLHLIRLNSIQI